MSGGKRRMKQVIAIEGLVGCGKSSLAEELLNNVPNSILIDGSKMYRAAMVLLLKYMRKNKSKPDFSGFDIKKFMDKMGLEIKIEGKKTAFYINGEKISEEEINSNEISMAVSSHSGTIDNIALFRFAHDFITKLRQSYNIILTGRGLPKIYPEVTYHFFMIASLEERVNRRYNEFEGKYNKEETKKAIIKRDELQEKAGYYEKTPHTIEIDTTVCKNAREQAIILMQYITI